MKESDKFKKRSDQTEAGAPKAKSTLLQTYFSSLLCLILCVTMFLGTSFAWFSSEVNNTANEIYIGTLDVGLFKQSGEVKVNLADSSYQLFDKNIRWEPGYTTLETVHVVNEGDLAFKYELSFTDGVLDGTAARSLEEVAKCFDVWVYDHLNKAAPEPASYEEITAQDSGWEKAGSLDELLAGKAVLAGVMEEVRDKTLAQTTNAEGTAPADETSAANEGTTDGVRTTATYTIALHMREDADSAVMKNKITLNVKLVAYQLSSEKDDIGDAYDSITAASNAAQLKKMLSDGGEVLLASDVEIETMADVLSMSGGVLDGNGKTVAYSGGRAADDSSVGVLNLSGGTVRNLKINGSDDGRAIYATALTSDLLVSNCVLSGAYSFNLSSTDVTDFTMVFTDTVFENWTSYANVIQGAFFTGCTFGDVLKPYGDTVLTACTIAKEGLHVSSLKKGETVELVNCSYNGAAGINAVITVDAEGNILLDCENDLLKLSEDNIVVLNSGEGENANA